MPTNRRVDNLTKNNVGVKVNELKLHLSQWTSLVNTILRKNVMCRKNVCVCVCSDIYNRSVSQSVQCSVMSDSLRPHGLQHAGLPVHHQLPEFTQNHVHRVGDAIQPSHPLSSPSPSTFNLSQHQGLFK